MGHGILVKTDKALVYMAPGQAVDYWMKKLKEALDKWKPESTKDKK